MQSRLGKKTRILFDEKEHAYSTEKTDEKGSYLQEVYGVTSLLANAGISSNFVHNEKAADFGKKGHLIQRLFLTDDLADYDPAFEPWMVGLRRFKEECSPNNWICLDDTILYSEKHNYAGQPDYLGMAKLPHIYRREALYLLDWKFWATATKGQIDDADIQTTAYAYAALEMKLIDRMPRRAVVHFLPETYHIEHLNDPSAWSTFLSALNIKKWKERHK